ncbi:AAA family ATPase [Gaetbulibacter jejuensis]|uniref:AAA family ATPase n=1 Tax=Gaetbulibacter jejuensis TaxID=584607 RepID=A0ABN1JZD0_9FLAO
MTAKTTKQLLLESIIKPFERIEVPPTVLSIDGVRFGSLGNFSCLTGKSKSRKTYLLSIFIAAALDSEEEIFQRIRSEVSGTNILHFDTEQAKHDTQKVSKRIHRLLERKEEIENYKCYCLRPHLPQTRIAIIEEAIYNTPNLKMVVIDGIADLIVGYNNEEKATEIINKFLKWTFELNIHIITVIHQNKGDNNAKGHLGSFVYQKAETVLSVEKDGNVSKVMTSHSRGVEIPPMSFSVNENDLPFFVDYIPSVNSKSKPTNPFDMDPDVHKNLLQDVFKNEDAITYSTLKEKIKFFLGSYSLPNGDSKCKEFLRYYKELKYITQEKNQGPYKLNKQWWVG